MAALGAARNGADIALDSTEREAVNRAMRDVAPQLVVNCAAMVSLDGCEADPGAAYAVNARSVSFLAEACRETGAKLVQISTDHYYTGDGSALHDEAAPVRLVNEYARTKFAGEAFALTAPGALVVRTNITGFRGHGGPTFAEWLISAMMNHEPMTLFTDFFTSTLDCDACAEAVLDLAAMNAEGVVNVAARAATNKRDFALALADELGITLDRAAEGSVSALGTARAESLGLDVSLAESLLGRSLPGLKQVAANLAQQYKRTIHA
jgi:dTDP-4-dehydrorhamnose reductase